MKCGAKSTETKYRSGNILLMVATIWLTGLTFRAQAQPEDNNVSYYKLTLDRWGVPEGYGRLEASTAKHLNSCYKVESNQGRVETIWRVNGMGQLVDDDDNFGASVEELMYRESDKIKEIVFKNHESKIVAKKIFAGVSPRDRSEIVAIEDEEGDPLPLKSSIDHTTDTEVCFLKQVYNLQGQTIEVNFLNDQRQPTIDEHGVWSNRFTYNNQGLLKECQNIGQNSEPWADSYGEMFKRHYYDSMGDEIRLEIHNEANQLVSGPLGYARVLTKYDEWGNEIKGEFFGPDERPTLQKTTGIASWTEKYDGHGNVVERRSFGIDGQPAVDIETGLTGWTRKDDKNGQVIESPDFDINGQELVANPSVLSSNLRTVWENFDKTVRTLLAKCFENIGWSMIFTFLALALFLTSMPSFFVLWLAENNVLHAADLVAQKFTAHILVGTFSMIGYWCLLLFSILLCFILVGLPLVFVLGLLGFVIGIYGHAVFFYWMGHKILSRFGGSGKVYPAYFIGFGLNLFLGLIPFFGFIYLLFAWVLCWGICLIALRDSFRSSPKNPGPLASPA